MSSYFVHLVFDLCCRAPHCAREHDRHTAASRACSWQSMRCAIIGYTNRRWINAKFLTDDLGDDCFGAIAPERREHGDGKSARWTNAYAHAFGCACQPRGRTWIMEPELSCAIRAALLACSQSYANIAALLAGTGLLLAPI